MKKESKHIAIRCAPGIILVEKPQKETSLSLTPEGKGKIVRSKVVSVGPALPLDGGLFFEPMCKAGDYIWHVKYDSEYDTAYIDDLETTFVGFKEVRGVEE